MQLRYSPPSPGGNDKGIAMRRCARFRVTRSLSHERANDVTRIVTILRLIALGCLILYGVAIAGCSGLSESVRSHKPPVDRYDDERGPAGYGEEPESDYTNTDSSENASVLEEPEEATPGHLPIDPSKRPPRRFEFNRKSLDGKPWKPSDSVPLPGD